MGLLSGILGTGNSDETKLDTSNIFPYIVTKEYLIQGTLVVDSLGHGLFTTLVYDLNGLVKNVKEEELRKAGLSNKEAFNKALENLEAVLRARKISINMLQGPGGIPFILVSDHWLSAATILATNIYSLGRSNLKADTIYASIPHRDVLLLFPKCTGAQLDSFKKMIKEKESGANKPLTFELFHLDNNGLKVVE